MVSKKPLAIQIAILSRGNDKHLLKLSVVRKSPLRSLKISRPGSPLRVVLAYK